MRSLTLLASLSLLVATAGLAQDNPITNGGFEQLDAKGAPVDWQYMGDCRIVPDAHSGKRAVLLQHTGYQGECGLNRDWQLGSGQQGTMLSQLKGGVRFWYKAEAAAGPESLTFFVIPMSAEPIENTGEMRATFRIPEGHVGDEKWHEGVLKYDFTGNPKAKWVHISPRVSGKGSRLLLDDITWVPEVGPLPGFGKVVMEEVKGKEGLECLLRATVINAGDQPLTVGTASVQLPPGLSAEGGPDQPIPALQPDANTRLTWRVTGRRDDKGQIGLKLSAAGTEALTSVTFAPALEVIALATREFIIAPNQPARVTLRLRNTGHAMVRALAADLRPGAPLAVSGSAQQSLVFLPPQTEGAVFWDLTARKQAPRATVRATVKAANATGGAAEAFFVIGGALPAAASPARPAVGLTDTAAEIRNEYARMVFPRSDGGYGLGVVQVWVEGQWVTVARMPRLTRLVVQTAKGKAVEHLVYAQSAREIPSPEAVAAEMTTRRLALEATLTDANGCKWSITQTVTLRPGSDTFALEVEATPDRAARVLALDGPMVYAGEGSPAGTKRLDAIFPGLEWLVEGEESSSTLDIVANHPDRLRHVPHPHMVTVPLASVRLALPENQGALVALLWDQLQPYYAKLDRPSAVFASPDRFAGHASTLMGLLAPSLPDYIRPNKLVADKPLVVAANQRVSLDCRLLARAAQPGETSLEAVKVWFRSYGVPEPNPLPHGKTWGDEVEFSSLAYLDSLWDPKLEKWHPSFGGPALWATPSLPPANLYDLRMCLETTDDPALKQRVRERYDRTVALSQAQPVADDMGFHFAGPADSLVSHAGHIAGLIRQQGEDGSWRFSARIETSGVFKGMDYGELGPDQAAEVGTCARTACTILAFARLTGDPNARAAGLKALAFMDRFEVPRAAQVWEVPVHTPDVLASADACEAYLEGYHLTGDRKYLDQAVYWAWTGLPFIYVWDTPGYEFLKYGSIPVFGATWYQGSWFGRPVQWNGLKYAYVLMQLAREDQSLDWAKVARGITVSCLYQQSTDEKDRALWPDSTGAIDRLKSAWIFAPRQILQNVYGEMGLQVAPLTAPVKAGEGDLRVSAAGVIKDGQFADGKLSFAVTYTPPQTGYVVVCGTSRPAGVTVNGQPAAETPLPRDGVAPCWRYLDWAGLLELRLSGTGEHRVEVTGVRFVAAGLQPPAAKRLDFDFATGNEGWAPVNHLTDFAVEQGILVAGTTGGDPYMVRNNCELAAAEVKQVRVRMALDAGLGAAAQFYWTTVENPAYEEAKVRGFAVVPDGEFHEYVIPVGEHELWRGTVTGLRLDPANGPGAGKVRVDFIRGE